MNPSEFPQSRSGSRVPNYATRVRRRRSPQLSQQLGSSLGVASISTFAATATSRYLTHHGGTVGLGATVHGFTVGLI